VLGEAEQLLQAVALAGIFRQPSLFEAKAIDFGLEFAIALAGVAEVDIVGPDAANAEADGVGDVFGGADDADYPEAEQTDTLPVR
jgi:hypothetical protein